MLAYVNGFFAGLSGCVLPVLAVLVSKKNKYRFVAEFFLAQFLLFALLNLFFAAVYQYFEWLQPILLLIAAGVTFYSAYSIYTGKSFGIPSSGALYGLALSPCSIGFAVATATTSFGWVTAIANAFLFALGIVTPIAVVAFILKSVNTVVSKSKWIEHASVFLLVLVSYYLAYLAGASWRWVP
ncbi:MAG: hypothetical protein PWP76_80 [Candidatus Diapherotrites archaeon]|nr:hypothetical protein [Candidatus Diapherotrites archaeon]MDN5367234.1 hypothetical protein [Candidatus Diapherotrites archaeon]